MTKKNSDMIFITSKQLLQDNLKGGYAFCYLKKAHDVPKCVKEHIFLHTHDTLSNTF